MEGSKISKICNRAINIIIGRKTLLNSYRDFLQEFSRFTFTITPVIYIQPNDIDFHVGTLRDVEITRHELRENMGEWKDSLVTIDTKWSDVLQDFNCEYIWEYKYKGIYRIEIILVIPFKQLPKELFSIKEGCEFEEKETEVKATTSKTLSYICKKKE